MKRLLQTGLLILAMVPFMQAKATTVSLTAVYTWNPNPCPLPAEAYLAFDGTATGYTPSADSITVSIYWGDGTSESYNVGLADSSGIGHFTSWGSIPHTYALAGSYTPFVIATGPDGEADTLASNSITVTSGCAIIDGYTYTDINGNCVYDAGDMALSGQTVVVTDGSGTIIQIGYSNASGYYSLSLPTGLSSLSITAIGGSWFTLTCPLAGSYSFSSLSSSTYDFGFECTGSSADYYVHHTAYCGFGVPGGTGLMSLVAKVTACPTPYPATITVTMDPLITYTSMITGPAPSSIVGSVLTWNVILVPGTNLNLKFNTATSPLAVVMTPACFDIDITGSATDPNLANNTEHRCLTIGGPYDPNNKEVIPAGTGSEGYVEPETEFEYTVNFQNTGTAPAINVYVIDTISTNLNLSTFEIIASSHTMNPIFTNGNIVRFDYPGINLPDSTTNEALSHGWVKYRIKAKSGLPQGTAIKNTGHIYFDYNAAIVTNTTVNTIDLTLGIPDAATQNKNILVYPNPSGTYVNIKVAGAAGSTAYVYDMTGKAITQISLIGDETRVDISGLTNGLYEIRIPGANGQTARFQKID